MRPKITNRQQLNIQRDVKPQQKQKRKKAKANKNKNMNFIVDHDEYSDPPFDVDFFEDEITTKVDEEHSGKLFHAPQYAEKIIINMQLEEPQSRIHTEKFYEIQKEININMRTIVVRWLVNVHHDFSLSSESLFNAIYYFDYTLSQVTMKKSQLQLLGITCLWMASKVEELRPLNILELIDLCNMKYTLKDVEDCERMVFKSLNFRLRFPHTKSFLRRYLYALDASQQFADVANFVCECSLFCYDLNKYNPSTVAVAIIVIASTCLRSILPLKKLHLYSHISNFKNVEEIIILLVFSAKDVFESKKGAIYQRYTNPKLSMSLLNISFDDDLMKHIQRLNIAQK